MQKPARMQYNCFSDATIDRSTDAATLHLILKPAEPRSLGLNFIFKLRDFNAKVLHLNYTFPVQHRLLLGNSLCGVSQSYDFGMQP